MSERKWRPVASGYLGWIVVFDGEGKRPDVTFMKDGAPLKFWNKSSAQLKADALNRRGEPS